MWNNGTIFHHLLLFLLLLLLRIFRWFFSSDTSTSFAFFYFSNFLYFFFIPLSIFLLPFLNSHSGYYLTSIITFIRRFMRHTTYLYANIQSNLLDVTQLPITLRQKHQVHVVIYSNRRWDLRNTLFWFKHGASGLPESWWDTYYFQRHYG